MFDGVTGAEMDTVDYYPQSVGEKDGVKWDISSWGDNWGNRSERYNACVFYENGETPSSSNVAEPYIISSFPS